MENQAVIEITPEIFARDVHFFVSASPPFCIDVRIFLVSGPDRRTPLIISPPRTVCIKKNLGVRAIA